MMTVFMIQQMPSGAMTQQRGSARRLQALASQQVWVSMLDVHWPKTMLEDNKSGCLCLVFTAQKTMIGDNNASCQLGPTIKLVHVMQVSETHIGNPRIIMTARILRHVPEHAAVQKLPSQALAVLQQNLGEVIEVSITLDPLYIIL